MKIYLVKIGQFDWDNSWSDIVCAFSSLEKAREQALDKGYNFLVNGDYITNKVQKSSWKERENIWSYRDFEIEIEEIELHT